VHAPTAEAKVASCWYRVRRGVRLCDGSNYNSRPLAAEVLIRDGHCWLIRRRQTFDDLIRGEEIPPVKDQPAPAGAGKMARQLLFYRMGP